jgi:geranylgeranyl diphosphate synthase type II
VLLAVEFIHTYSLIHDDLPSMDDDNERRGLPTNHIVYGEAMALLGGDALLTESFNILATGFKDNPSVGLEVCRIVSEAAGAQGMVGGQAMDILLPEDGHDQDQIQWIHKLKTGCLIRASVEAAAVACEATSAQRTNLTKFAECLGFAFQLADDIDDYDPKNPESTSYVNVYGLEKTASLLAQVTDEALSYLVNFGEKKKDLAYITEFNQQRISGEETNELSI